MKILSTRIKESVKNPRTLAAIVVTGFLLRLSGIFWGTPFPNPLEGDYNPDEVRIIRGAVEFPRHILDNLTFFYPTFFHYFLGIITFPLREFFEEFGLPESGFSGSTFYYVVTVIGRLCSVLAGTGAIFLTYFFAKDVFDQRRALLASAFLAFTLYHAVNSAVATTDVLTSFFLVLFLFMLRRAFLKPESSSFFVYSGIIFGLLVGTKYIGAIASLAILLLYGYTLFKQSRNEEIRAQFDQRKFHLNLLLCSGAAVFMFFLTTPGILLHFDAFIDSINYLRTDLGRHSLSRSDPATWLKVFQKFAVAVGFPLAGACILGLFFPYKKNVYEWSFITILFIFFIYFEATLRSRYIILVAPLVAMIASNGTMWVYESGKKPFQILGLSIITMVLMYSFGSCVAGAYLRVNDIRTQAGRYIYETFPQGTSIGTGYTSEALGQTIHYWRYPNIDDTRFRLMDFLDFPEVVIVSSGGGWNMEWALESDKLSEKHIWDERYNNIWWEFSPPSPRVFRFYKESLDSKRSTYVLLKTFKRSFPIVLEYTPPEIKVFVRRSYGPQMIRRNYYATNPRGYFQEEDIRKWRWGLRVQDGSKADLLFPQEDPEVVRIAITQVGSDIPWNVQLNQVPLQIKNNHEYVLRFRARADDSRSMVIAVGQTYDPWQTIGLYHPVRLTDEWQDHEFSFRAEADEPHARVYFDLGESVVPVEIADVQLRHKSDILLASFNGTSQGRSVPSELIEPDLPDKYYVDYRFNAMGCRGRDYSIPRSPEGMRILILGDSLALGAGVRQADTLASQLESLLNNGSPREEALSGNEMIGQEVINCGVGGYGTHDAARFYENIVSKYEPDVVLLVMAPDDDQSWIEEAEQDTSDRLNKPHNQFVAWSSHQERLYDRLASDYSESLEEVIHLQQLVQAKGGRLGVVVFRYTRHRAWEPLVQQLTQSIQGRAFPVLDLGETLLASHSEEELFVHERDKHPNEIAHGLAARQIFDFLGRENFVPLPTFVAAKKNQVTY